MNAMDRSGQCAWSYLPDRRGQNVETGAENAQPDRRARKIGDFRDGNYGICRKFEPTAPLKGRVDQPVSRKSREIGLERESEPAAGMAPPKILDF
jgi:hypothetical protein